MRPRRHRQDAPRGAEAATLALTSTDDRAFSDQALLAGAQDVLLKGGLSAQALVRCIEHARSRQGAQERINDDHGHDTGDAVLMAVSQRFRSAVRE